MDITGWGYITLALVTLVSLYCMEHAYAHNKTKWVILFGIFYGIMIARLIASVAILVLK